MSRLVTNASDLGEHADFIMESAVASPDVLDLLLEREEEGDYVYHQDEVQISPTKKGSKQ